MVGIWEEEVNNWVYVIWEKFGCCYFKYLIGRGGSEIFGDFSLRIFFRGLEVEDWSIEFNFIGWRN